MERAALALMPQMDAPRSKLRVCHYAHTRMPGINPLRRTRPPSSFALTLPELSQPGPEAKKLPVKPAPYRTLLVVRKINAPQTPVSSATRNRQKLGERAEVGR